MLLLVTPHTLVVFYSQKVCSGLLLCTSVVPGVHFRTVAVEARMREILNNLWRDDTGQDAAEYSLLLLMIALALILSIQAFKSAIANAFGRATGQLSSVT